MNPPVRRGQDAQNQGGQRDGQGGPRDGDGNGNGGGGNENGQDGEESLRWLVRMLLLATWNPPPSDQDKDNLEQEAISRSPAQEVQIATMLKINRTQALVVQLNTRVNQAQGQVAAATTHLPGRLRQRHMVLRTWIVSGLRHRRSMGTRRRASMCIVGSQLVRIIFELLPTRITSSWHPLIKRVDPVPCGQMCMRRTRGQMVGMSPLTLVSSFVRRQRRSAEFGPDILGHLERSEDGS
jgi:hypothetical protein